MLFSSLTFLFLFLPLVVVGYFLAPNLVLKNVVLLLFSLVFYAWKEPIYLILMLIVIFIAYIFGLLIERSHHRLWLFLGVSSILGVLFYFKYWNFIFGRWFYFENLILPIGISFYTFQTLSYLIDVARGCVVAQHSLVKLGLMLRYFLS